MADGAVYKIVVAEDEELILNSIVKKITAANIGFEVVGTAQDGKKALEQIEKFSPDLLLTDIRMPVMDGIELVKAVSSRFPHIIKIIISGYSEFKYAQQALKYEVKDYLLKPLKKQELLEALNRTYICLEARKNLLQQNVLQKKENTAYTPEEISHMVEAYIKENYTHEINFDLVAQSFNYTSSYLSRIFTKNIGENPSKYLISLRINKAKHLLLTQKELSIKETGELVGYPNQYHFSHIFKIVTGKSPANFRDEALKESD